MKFKSNQTKLVTKDTRFFLYVEAPGTLANELNDLCNKDVDKTIEIKQYREQRSTTANRYMWTLITELSEKLTLPRGDTYIKLLKSYGKEHQFTIKDEALTELIRSWNFHNTTVAHTESLCDVTRSFRSKGQLWHDVSCYEGSSGYDSKVFSVLLNGIVSDCETMGINTMTPDEIERLMANYEN